MVGAKDTQWGSQPASGHQKVEGAIKMIKQKLILFDIKIKLNFITQ